MGEYLDTQPIWENTHMDNDPAWTPRRRLSIVTVGAGFSALIFAHKLQHEQPELQDLVDHTIYETRSDIGGTWLVNRYPGVQCDVPAHVYTFPFAPNPEWTHFYATGQQIHDYMKDTTRKWNLDRDVKLNHKVIETIWIEDLGRWKITVETNGTTFTRYADILISAQGVLHYWKWPKLDGFDTFKGHKCHSAGWDESYNYSGKKIAVLGNGSSGVQIIPKLAKLPSTELLCFQRSPNFVYTPFQPAILMGRPEDTRENPPYTEEEIKRFKEDPIYHRDYRRQIIHRINAGFPRFLKGSPASAAVTSAARAQMELKLKHDPELCAKLIPDWALGCRRITPAEGYLEALQKPNVELVTEGVVRVNEDSVFTADGRSWKIDVLACATGFDVSLKPSWNMIGRNRVNLRDEFEIDPVAYLAVAAKDMPNYFIFMGPNAVVAHGSLIEAINWSAGYICKWIKKIATEDIKSVVPRSQVVDELVRYEERVHQNFIWSDTCSSWFKRNTVKGRNIAAFGGSALLYKQLINEIRAEDFEIEYKHENRWNFLGNGLTSYELDSKNDLGWYLDH